MKTTTKPILTYKKYPNNKSANKRKYGLYMCVSCKVFFYALVDNVNRRGYAKCKSCSCTRHGDSRTKLYHVWQAIKERTRNSKSQSFKWYGVRGISITDEWANDFANFRDWALQNGYEENLTIDRIDNNGNYEPSNCRWVGMDIQAQNTRKTRTTNSTGYRGVSDNCFGKYRARIHSNGKQIHIGTFNNKEDAARAYDEYVVKNGTAHTRNLS